MEEWQERVYKEFDELADKLTKLKTFLATGIFDRLTPHEKDLLTLQYYTMKTYATVLKARINFFTKLDSND